jgi:hypothetical protein
MFLPAGKGGNVLQAESRWGASYPTQFKVLLDRAVRVRRFQAFSTQDLLQFLVIGEACVEDHLTAETCADERLTVWKGLPPAYVVCHAHVCLLSQTVARYVHELIMAGLNRFP